MDASRFAHDARRRRRSNPRFLQMNPKPASIFAFCRPSCKPDARCFARRRPPGEKASRLGRRKGADSSARHEVEEIEAFGPSEPIGEVFDARSAHWRFEV